MKDMIKNTEERKLFRAAAKQVGEKTVLVAMAKARKVCGQPYSKGAWMNAGSLEGDWQSFEFVKRFLPEIKVVSDE